MRLAFLGCKSATFKIFSIAAQKRIPTTKHVYEDRARAVVISGYEAHGAGSPRKPREQRAQGVVPPVIGGLRSDSA